MDRQLFASWVDGRAVDVFGPYLPLDGAP